MCCQMCCHTGRLGEHSCGASLYNEWTKLVSVPIVVECAAGVSVRAVGVKARNRNECVKAVRKQCEKKAVRKRATLVTWCSMFQPPLVCCRQSAPRVSRKSTSEVCWYSTAKKAADLPCLSCRLM